MNFTMTINFKHTSFFLLTLAALALLSGGTVHAQQASSLEYATLYKSPRAMGMGGAYVAVGGRSDTLFYNPAGLSAISRDEGWEVNLVNVSGELGNDSDTFLRELNRALDNNDNGGSSSDSLTAVNDVLTRYRGRDLHVRAADFTSVGKRFDSFAFAVGALGSATVDAIPHQGMGSDGMLSMKMDATYGGVGGASFGVANNVYAGFGAKVLKREAMDHEFSARELVAHQNDLSDYIQDDLRTNGNGVGFDAGLLWKPAQDTLLRPSFGISVLNIGDLNFGAAGKINQTVNVGVAVNPRVPMLKSVIIAADYVDVACRNRPDKDSMKRLRYGTEALVYDSRYASLALRAGMYESYPAFGVEARLAVITLSYVSYGEEIGAYAGQDRNKRQLFTVNIGW
jgi:hypothetical protein